MADKNFMINSFQNLIFTSKLCFTFITDSYTFLIVSVVSRYNIFTPISQILIREYHLCDLILQFMCNLLQHFGLFITTYRAGIYLAAFLGTGGIGYDRIAISMLPGGRDVFCFNDRRR